jgi:hypothetical protein
MSGASPAVCNALVCAGYSWSILINSDSSILVVRDASLFMTPARMAAKHVSVCVLLQLRYFNLSHKTALSDWISARVLATIATWRTRIASHCEWEVMTGGVKIKMNLQSVKIKFVSWFLGGVIAESGNATCIQNWLAISSYHNNGPPEATFRHSHVRMSYMYKMVIKETNIHHWSQSMPSHPGIHVSLICTFGTYSQVTRWTS